MSGTGRCLVPWMALVLLLSGCRAVPFAGAPLPADSSMLAVEVVFPVPLGRDPTLVRAYFVKGVVHRGLEELPELVPASFVKGSRAYLLDPESGTYSLVAVASDFAPPLRTARIEGVRGTVASGPDVGHVVVFPVELIGQTRTTVGRGRMKLMGVLRIRPGERINASTKFQDNLQARIAESIRPEVTSKTGIAGMITNTWMVDLEESSLSNTAADREAFQHAARAELGESPWAKLVPAPALAVQPVPTRPARAARSRVAFPRTPARAPSPAVGVPAPETAAPDPAVGVPVPETAAPDPAFGVPVPETAAPDPKVGVPVPEIATTSQDIAATVPEIAATVPEPAAPTPERRRITGVPASSALARLEVGMSHDDVLEILGDPDQRKSYPTSRAWIPFYTGSDAQQIDWMYEGRGRVVFSVDGVTGSLEVIDAVHDPSELR